MGNSDSKLVFRQGIFRLASDERIPPTDVYWQSFYALPSSADDVFSLFTATDIRRARDVAPHNVETLVEVLVRRLLHLQKHRSFPHAELAPEKELLNCVRVLTRILPFLHESPGWHEREQRLFWQPRAGKGANLLGNVLLDHLVDLLFFEGFTISNSDKSRVSYAIWQEGIGCIKATPASGTMESNRVEVLRLLLSLTGKALYVPAHVLPEEGVEALTHLASCPDKQIVLSLLCSLMNATLQYTSTSWSVPYNLNLREPLVLYSMQLLLTLIIYPIPNGLQKNQFRHFLGRLHRLSDFEFMMRGIASALEQEMHAKTSYLQLYQTKTSRILELIMLFWEMLQCNKRFRSFVIDSHYGRTMTILMLFFAAEYRADAARQGVVRMCMFTLQTMSVETNFGRLCNQEIPCDNVPLSMRPTSESFTYADLLMTSTYSLITGGQCKLDAVFPSLLATINNIAPYVEHLSPAASVKLLRLFMSFSEPSFYLANETNHFLLESILHAINAMVEHQYMDNQALIMHLFKCRSRVEALRAFTLDRNVQEIKSPSMKSPDAGNNLFAIGEDEENAAQSPSTVLEPVPTQLRGMSEKARGKLPAGQPAFIRQNSSSSLNTYRSNPSSPVVGQSPFGCQPASPSTDSTSFRPGQAWLDQWVHTLPLHTLVNILASPSPPATLPPNIEKTAPRIHSFEWTSLSLGWYESLLWGSIFAAEVQVQQRGTLGIWNHTHIRLFRVKADAAHGPTLREPLGAVDAVGRKLVSGVQHLVSSAPQDDNVRIRDV